MNSNDSYKQVLCPICGEKFTPNPHQIAALKKGHNAFCSTDCRTERGRKRSRRLCKDKLKKEIFNILNQINSTVSEAIKSDALDIAEVVGGRGGFTTHEVAKAVVAVACDRNNIGYKLKTNPRALRMVRKQSGISPITDVRDVIPKQVEILAIVAGWDQDEKEEIKEKSLDIAETIKNIRGTLAVQTGAIIYIASVVINERITQQEIGEVIGASRGTIKDAAKDLTEKLGISL